MSFPQRALSTGDSWGMARNAKCEGRDFHLFIRPWFKHSSFFYVYEEEHYQPFFFFFSLLEHHEHIVSLESMSEFLL